MGILVHFHQWIEGLGLPLLLIAGIMIFAGFYFGKTMKFIKLPSIIGYMIIGVVLGPSLLNLLPEAVQGNLSFLTSLALGFVAISIGLELKFSTLKKQGSAIILIILMESFLAFFAVTAVVYLVTHDLPLALIFGAIAPASAPAGTVAVIQEYKAKGPMTSALFSVVGFDDGLCIIIFGFASAFAKNILLGAEGAVSPNFWLLMGPPLLEIGLSIVIGSIMGVVFSFLVRRLKNGRDILILIFGSVLLTTGLCEFMHLSLILTNMVTGIFIINTQTSSIIKKISDELSMVMPLLFILFFVLAGANLHVAALPSLGLLGMAYILARTAGLMGGASLGATIGKAEPMLKKYLGMGILSQAGVAIGLALIVKQEFSHISPWGEIIGNTVITTVTATCIFFEIIGPVLTRHGLQKAGEIKVS
ncbi:MAG: cation:proton antiporter [Spirochaetales bacterium]|nr:cation:proton antiporter [Spirochaetales bacterium]